jgi:urease accessory protein
MPAIRRAVAAAGSLTLAFGVAAPALAHPGHGEASLLQGLAHPFSGLDHFLAMVAVGLWAWPAAFVLAMLGGFVLGQGGLELAVAEPAILASVVIIGGAAAFALPAPILGGASLIAGFGFVHGYVHGVEAPGAGIGFPLGLVAATALLHLIGLSAGLAFARRPMVVRILGGAAALGGVVLALGA